jgi:hypothetical protein
MRCRTRDVSTLSRRSGLELGACSSSKGSVTRAALGAVAPLQMQAWPLADAGPPRVWPRIYRRYVQCTDRCLLGVAPPWRWKLTLAPAVAWCVWRCHHTAQEEESRCNRHFDCGSSCCTWPETCCAGGCCPQVAPHCIDGECRPCPVGWGLCPDSSMPTTCIDLQHTESYCGSCHVSCPSGTICCGGRCVPASDWIKCGGRCAPRTICPAERYFDTSTCKCECAPVTCEPGYVQSSVSCTCQLKTNPCPYGPGICYGLYTCCQNPWNHTATCCSPGQRCDERNVRCF